MTKDHFFTLTKCSLIYLQDIIFICSLEINPHTAIEFTHLVTPGVAPTVQALHLFKLFMMLENNVTRTFIRQMNLKRQVNEYC